MNSIEDDLRLLFADIEDCAQRFAKDSKLFLSKFRLLPPTIGLGNGRVLWLSYEGLGAVERISRAIRSNSHKLRSAVSETEMAQLTSNAVGQLLVPDATRNVSFSLPTDLISFKRKLKNAIENKLASSKLKRTHIFGAWLFQNEQNRIIKIGPLKFLEKRHWLKTLKTSRMITAREYREIRRAWCARSEIKRNTRKAFDAKMLFDAVGPCDWVCEIDVFGHSVGRSREKALLAARIGLAAIALNWEQPSRFLTQIGLYYDVGRQRHRTTMAYSKNSFVSASMSSVDVRNYYLQDYSEFQRLSNLRLRTIGRALKSFVSVTPEGQKIKLERRLCLALVWFSEACREKLPFLAIVKFAAALDTLANGGRANGICEMLKNRLSLKAIDARFLKDGTTAKSLVSQIYNGGRSEIVHGARPSLVDDLDQLRSHAETVATYALRACIHWLNSYSGPDNDSAFRMSP